MPDGHMNAWTADRGDAGRRARAGIVAEAMEVVVGRVQPSEELLADAARYVAGQITIAEMLARTRARYGLD